MKSWTNGVVSIDKLFVPRMFTYCWFSLYNVGTHTHTAPAKWSMVGCCCHCCCFCFFFLQNSFITYWTQKIKSISRFMCSFFFWGGGVGGKSTRSICIGNDVDDFRRCVLCSARGHIKCKWSVTKLNFFSGAMPLPHYKWVD